MNPIEFPLRASRRLADASRHLADRPLSLNGIVASALPWNLGTAGAPSKYAVSVTLSRPAEPHEIDLLNEWSTLRRLDNAGYPGIVLSIAHRRLLIGNTSLDQLTGGLARELARLFRDLSATARAQTRERGPELEALAMLERERREAVAALAAEVHFTC